MCVSTPFHRGKWSRKDRQDDNKLVRAVGRNLDFTEKSQLWLNDLPIKDPTPRHVKKAFDDDPALKHIQVVCPDDKQTEADLNKKIYLDEMAPKRLSSITKASARAYTPASSRLLIFRFDYLAGAFRQVSYDLWKKIPTIKLFAS